MNSIAGKTSLWSFEWIGGKQGENHDQYSIEHIRDRILKGTYILISNFGAGAAIVNYLYYQNWISSPQTTIKVVLLFFFFSVNLCDQPAVEFTFSFEGELPIHNDKIMANMLSSPANRWCHRSSVGAFFFFFFWGHRRCTTTQMADADRSRKITRRPTEFSARSTVWLLFYLPLNFSNVVNEIHAVEPSSSNTTTIMHDDIWDIPDRH